MNDAWVQFLGRLHPLLLHLPIGVLAALFFLEVWSIASKQRPMSGTARRPLAALLVLAALVTAGSGWLLAEEPGYGGAALEDHRNAGLLFAGVVLLTALCALNDWRRVYAPLLLACIVLVVPAGHYGAELTHGEDFLVEPFEEPTTTSNEVQAAAESPFEKTVAPILASRCASCHGDGKHKGGLSLDTQAGILAGGEHGAVIEPGSPESSDLVRRLRLPLDDKDHMPPSKKRQPSEQEIAAIERWIAAGASFDGAAMEPVAAVPAAFHPKPRRVLPSTTPEAALDVLAAEQVHVETIDPADGLLWIDFSARPTTDDAYVTARLAPLAPLVTDLSLAGTQVDDDALEILREMPRLERLDLSDTACTSLAALADHPALKTLTITRTSIGDDAVDVLAGLPELEHLFSWDSRLTPAGLDRLRTARPDLVVDAGEATELQPLETEPEVVFAKPGTLTAKNEKCPVSGEPIDPKYLVVVNGEVIGFCCEKCALKYWQEPKAFASGD